MSRPDLACGVRRLVKAVLSGDQQKMRHRLTDLRFSVAGSRNSAATTLDSLLPLIREAPEDLAPLARPVDIIIPVYNGRHHVERLFASFFERTDPRHRIFIVDDASSDPAVVPLLNEITRRHANVVLLCNEANLGFVRTVNAAAERATGHFVLLNSDVEVPPFWLERLMRPIFDDDEVASTTPFSNAATILSFPEPNRDNPVPPDLSILDIASAFARLDPEFGVTLELPSGVGFCMGINGRIWREVGPFDAATFGAGYGEEIDWCLRAGTAGGRHVLAADLFVYHFHGGSFPSKMRADLVRRNARTVNDRWPHFYGALARFNHFDACEPLRKAATLAMALALEARPLIVLDHEPGSGRADDFVEKAVADGRGVCHILDEDGRGYIHVHRSIYHTSIEVGDPACLPRLARLGETIEVIELR